MRSRKSEARSSPGKRRRRIDELQNRRQTEWLDKYEIKCYNDDNLYSLNNHS